VRIARNGREALEAVRESKPDLVLMDVMMPEMDGLTATRELRRDPAYRDLPIIVLTAKAMRDDYQEALTAGANDYMAKPIDVDKLVSLSRVWISR
jgi:CheY-like chemotaxis protein